MECTEVALEELFTDDPALEGGDAGRQKGDPSPAEIWGRRGKSGKLLTPGLTQEIQRQGFMLINKCSPAELAECSPEERAALDKEQEQIKSLAQEGIAEFHPPWNEFTRLSRRKLVPGEHGEYKPEEIPFTVQEVGTTGYLAGLLEPDDGDEPGESDDGGGEGGGQWGRSFSDRNPHRGRNRESRGAVEQEMLEAVGLE